MGKIGTVQEVPIENLRPYERNARTHDQDQVEKIAKSIEEFGFLNPILIDKDKNVIAGHGRIMAAKKLGMEKVPVLFIEGLTEEQRRAYILADNRLTEMGGWNQEILQQELDDLEAAGFDISLTGFSVDFTSFDVGETEAFPGEEKREEARSKRGEIWELGNHRLMVGDSTSMKDVDTLMGDRLADLLLTDPPYGVDYESWKGMTIQADDLQGDDLEEFLAKAFINACVNMKPGAAFYIWHASSTMHEFLMALARSDLVVHQQIMWVKNRASLGRQDYQWRHEPCFYGWKEGAAHYFIDMRTLTTVEEQNIEDLSKEELIELIHEMQSASSAIPEDKPTRSDDHPTMKPVPLFEKLIRNSTRGGGLVLDLFGGSGTTLLAAEKMGRSCYMMEIDPGYADVIINRWEEMTGKKAVLKNHV